MWIKNTTKQVASNDAKLSPVQAAIIMISAAQQTNKGKELNNKWMCIASTLPIKRKTLKSARKEKSCNIF